MMNRTTRPRIAKWRVINATFRALLRLGISRSNLAFDMAHTENGTALHWAAAKGNIKVVRFLLRNGAYQSIHSRNKMGCTPLELARIFGPHPEVSALTFCLDNRLS